MTNIRKIARLIVAVFTSITSISLLAAIIYFYADYEMNVLLNSNIDDYTIYFIFGAFFIFVFISFMLFYSVFSKNVKIQNDTKEQ